MFLLFFLFLSSISAEHLSEAADAFLVFISDSESERKRTKAVKLKQAKGPRYNNVAPNFSPSKFIFYYLTTKAIEIALRFSTENSISNVFGCKNVPMNKNFRSMHKFTMK